MNNEVYITDNMTTVEVVNDIVIVEASTSTFLVNRISINGFGEIVFFASDGITQIALLDDNGNFWIKGNYLTL